MMDEVRPRKLWNHRKENLPGLQIVRGKKPPIRFKEVMKVMSLEIKPEVSRLPVS